LISGINWSWLDATDHDFGDIEHRKEVSHDFRFVNKGDTPLTIDNIRTSCGCTTPDWSEAPVLPGDTSIIQISYDARDPGYFRKLTKVYFHGQRKAEKLYIEGYVLE
jgi:hypothetical protein